MKLGELIEKLCISNIKLYNLCDQKADMALNPDKFSKEDMAEVMHNDIALCKERAALKNAIDKFANLDVEEIKMYGN